VYRPSRRLPAVVIPLLVLVATAGYLIGIHRASAPSVSASSPASSGQAPLIASGANVLIAYPPSWRPASSPPPIPGLVVTSPLLLAPAGNAANAGLLSGQMPASETTPLPASFLALVHGIPPAEVVSLVNVQAYRYRNLTGYARTLDLYVIPTVGGSPAVLVCYAAAGYSKYLNQCGQIVSNVTLVGQSSYDLTPSASYAGQLAPLITKLDAERVKLRHEITQRATLSAVTPLAVSLAERFARVAASLSALEAPQAASGAQATLANAMVNARNAYTALAEATKAEDLESYDAAKRKVEEAEAAVNKALEGFALLGYSHT
jgi:hypothetical protein